MERSEREGIETNDSGKGNGNRRVYEYFLNGRVSRGAGTARSRHASLGRLKRRGGSIDYLGRLPLTEMDLFGW